MGTYLFLLNKLLFQNKWKLAFTILFPLFLLTVVFPFATSTVEESSIPIAWVDQEKEGFAETIGFRINEDPRIQLLHVNSKEEAIVAVRTGKVEAAFILDEQFNQHIKSGDIRKQMEWIRTSRSFLDTFVKEKVAAEVMRFALNSKAANDLQQLKRNEEDFNWEVAFQHADQYWEPEPLFQMDFVPSNSGDLEQEEAIDNLTIGLLGFWMWYTWIIFAGGLLPIYQWKEKGLLDRIRLRSGSIRAFISSFYLVQTLFYSLLFFLLITLTLTSLKVEMNAVNIYIPAFIGFISMLLLTMIVNLFIKKQSVYLMLIIIYSMLSFVFSFLAISSGFEKWWSYILPHYWFYQLML
ncbi:hypothetical protein HNQ94_000250 [Salirhabdus euzebyi]|uniref:ABC-2 type transporter transmembrane domain-containing protein n=1 Tax=Salirhabdus euzebyi TaxID=394506 RepID=A0A841PSP4_9BACI|nr:ABC transporter permease [Salirhabdus euzebyi]MBB6451829.1 hypothetical protein [Salirhabdus euzebyi]